MSQSISRRDFLKASATGTATLAVASVLNACSPKVEGTVAENKCAEETTITLRKADETLTTDVLVIGIGTTGILASASAADKGKKVIAVEALANLTATNSVNTTGAWAIESTPQKSYPGYLTQEQAFLYMINGSLHQTNGKVLRNIIAKSGKAMDLLINGGVPFIYFFQMLAEGKLGAPFESFSPEWQMTLLGGFAFATYGPERAAAFQKILDDRKVTCLYETTAKDLIMDGNKVVGAQCETVTGKIIDIKAPSVIICTGGFLRNSEMVAKYFAGAKILGLGSPTCKGDGIRMAQTAGAQIGKNFSLALNELGGANDKASTRSAYVAGAYNRTFNLSILGGLLVDCQGNRFMDEGKMCEDPMFTSEPVVRDSKYYAVLDKAFLDKVSTTPFLDLFPPASRMLPAYQAAFTGLTLTDIYTDLDKAIQEGWAYKADTIEDLGSFRNMKDLASTVSEYNQYCKEGKDSQFYKDPKYLQPVETGPFYIAEFQPSGWVSVGGIKTDGDCRALTADNQPIPGLFIAGTDADLFSAPYFKGASAQGFCIASGYIAGEAAADYASGS